MSDKKGPGTLASVKFKTIAHFYDPDDPSPETARELSDRAEKAIFLTVLDVPDKKRSRICDHIELRFPPGELSPGRETAVIAALRSHFRSRSKEMKRDTNLTVRVGLRELRLTLLVGVPCFIGIAFTARFREIPIAVLALNILVIFCWVVIWQPFQSLVFDRWTEKETAGIYNKIADMDISVNAT